MEIEELGYRNSKKPQKAVNQYPYDTRLEMSLQDKYGRANLKKCKAPQSEDESKDSDDCFNDLDETCDSAESV